MNKSNKNLEFDLTMAAQIPKHRHVKMESCQESMV